MQNNNNTVVLISLITPSYHPLLLLEVQNNTRKHPSITPKLQDPFNDTDSSLEPSSRMENKFGIRFFFKYQKKCGTSKTLKLKCTNHNTIKTRYFAKIQDRINKTKNNKASGTKESQRNNNGPKI